MYPDGRMGPEISARTASMHDNLNVLAPALRRRSLSVAPKLSLVASMCHNGLLYNCAVWSPLRARDFRKSNVAYMRSLRSACSMHNLPDSSSRTTDAQVLAASAMESCQVAIYRRLLLYLVRLLRKGQPILLRLIALSLGQPGGWADRIKAALVALWLANETLQASMPDPLGYWDHWLMTIARSPASWRTTFAKASFHVVNQSAALLEEIPEPAQYVCEIPACGKTVFTRSAWLSHNARKHGYQNVFRSRLDSTICRGCSCQSW